MIQLVHKQMQKLNLKFAHITHDKSLQIVLWLCWTLTVIGTAYFSWHHDAIAHKPVNGIGLVIHCLMVGVIGLIVVTWIEMRVQPRRFYDE